MPQDFAEGESYRVIIGDGRCANLLVILVVGSGGLWEKSRLTGVVGAVGQSFFFGAEGGSKRAEESCRANLCV